MSKVIRVIGTLVVAILILSVPVLLGCSLAASPGHPTSDSCWGWVRWVKSR